MRILLIDDNYEDMSQFKDELTLEGHEVTHVHNFKEISEICDQQEPFDGIILDLMFPPENGIPIQESDFGYRAGEFLYEHKICYSYPKTPFVVLSAMDKSTGMYELSFKKMSSYPNFKGFIQKPSEIYDLLNTLFTKI